jgi:uncharacterized protein YgiM (DUF1202 family)
MKNKYFWLLVLLVLALNLINSRQSIFAQEPVQITAEVLYNNVNIRTQPNTRAEILGQLNMGTIVQVTGREDNDSESIWVYIVDPITQLTGWLNTEYIVFSHRTWADFVPIISSANILYPNGLDNPLEAFVIYGNLNVRAESNFHSSIIGELPIGTPVSILGRELYIESVYGPTSRGYVYIRQNDSNLEGWTSYDYLALLDGTPARTILDELPILNVVTIANVIEIEGQIIAAVYSEEGLHLRVEPNTNSEILVTIPHESLVAVYGRDSNHLVNRETWAYIKILETGQTGWVLDWPLYYPRRFDENSLPLLNTISSPALPSSATPINAISGVTNDRVTLRWTPEILDESTKIRVLAPDTALTIIGRNFKGDWFKVLVDGQTGWIYSRYLTFEGDFLRLPVNMIGGGYTIGYFDY